MKKRTRPAKSSRAQTRARVGEDNRAPVNRGRPRKNHSVATARFEADSSSQDKNEGPVAVDVTPKHPDGKAKSSGERGPRCCPPLSSLNPFSERDLF